MTLPETIPLLGFWWDDLLFMTLAAVMVGSALLVVTMKDIIRCGLAMIICFAALAGLYVLAGAPVVAGAQVLVYIGAISVLVLFAIMLTQTKSGPAALVFQTQAFPAAIAAAVLALLIAVTVAVDGLARRPAPGSGRTPRQARDDAVLGLHPPVRGGERPAAGRGDRRRVPRQARARGNRLMLAAPQRDLAEPGRLPRPVGPPVRDRHVRLPGPPQRDQHADVDRADAQRRQPRDHLVRGVQHLAERETPR